MLYKTLTYDKNGGEIAARSRTLEQKSYLSSSIGSLLWLSCSLDIWRPSVGSEVDPALNQYSP